MMVMVGHKGPSLSFHVTHKHTDLPVAAAIFCRAGGQDDSAGHQNLQQDHQDEVKIDLNTKRQRCSSYWTSVKKVR